MAAKDDLRDLITTSLSPTLARHLAGDRQELELSSLPSKTGRGIEVARRRARGLAKRLHCIALRCLRPASVACQRQSGHGFGDGRGFRRWSQARINSALRQMKHLQRKM